MHPMLRFAGHGFASIVTVVFLAGVPIVACFVGYAADPADGLMSLGLWLFLTLLIYGPASFVYTGVVLFPLSAIAEYLLRDRLKWPWWVHVLTMSVVSFAIGVTIVIVWEVVTGFQWSERECFHLLLNACLGGQFLAFGGLLYSLLLHASNALLNIRRRKGDVVRTPPGFG